MMRRVVSSSLAAGALATEATAAAAGCCTTTPFCSTCSAVRRVASAGGGDSGTGSKGKASSGHTFVAPGATAFHIGDITLPIRQGDFPERVPCTLPAADAFFPLNTETMGLMRWIAQKELLGQDMCLLGEPGPARRWLAMLYCRYAQREVQTLSLSRDTTEADIKQRKEIRKGTLAYLDQAAVTAALHGHVLILEGLERAERNVLPVLNNLLENREMNLDNGMMLLHPNRYDQLVTELGQEEVERLGLLRVSEHFRVIALAVPVPKYAGNPLDPPLRSRFQCLYVPPPSTAALWQSLSDSPTAAEALLKFKAALSATGEKGSDNDKTLTVEPLGDYEILELGRQHVKLPNVPLGSLLSRVYPWRLYTLRSQTGTVSPEPRGKRHQHLAEDDGTKSIHRLLKTYNMHNDEIPSSMWVERVVRKSEKSGSARIELKDGTHYVCPAGPISAGASASDAHPLGTTSACYFADPHRQLFTAMMQSHSCGRHMCLVGPPGCGKTVIVREFASQLGYPVHVQHLYADMSTRDLFQRRSTDSAGDTVWEPSALVEAAKLGHIAVLDGIDNLPPHTLCVLQELLIDGSATLLDGTLLKPVEDYLAMKERLGVTDEAMAERNVFPVHPNFRLIAVARPPSTKHGRKFWLTSDIACLFDYHVLHGLDSDVAADVIAHLVQSRQNDLKLDKDLGAQQISSSQLSEIINAVVALQQSLAQLAATEDSKIPQLSLRQLIRIAQYASYHPTELRSIVASTLLLPLMSPLSADLVLKQFAAAGIDTAAKSVATKVTSSISGFWKARNKSQRTPEEEFAAVGNEKTGIQYPPMRVEANENGVGVSVLLGDEPALCIRREYTAEERSLIPHVNNYYSNQQHTDTLGWLAKQLAQENKILLVGNQGVGKNKIVDHFLSTTGLPRHYIQLHRDTTVASLTINPRIEDGAVIWEDSPLVKAVSRGHVLVIDEIDKAPVDVVQVLKGLVEDKEMTLSDGRRISAWDEGISQADSDSTTDLHKKIIKLHPDFRLIVLANPPGYPFHGNDFYRECGDLFACHVLENPDAQSQEELLLRYAPQVPRRLLQQLISCFSDLRQAVREGTLQYPFSLRELIHVVRHLQAFPQDGVFQALNNVFNFDLEDTHTMDTVRRVLAKHLRQNAGAMRNRCAAPVELQRVENVAQYSLEEGLQLPATFVDYALSEPISWTVNRLPPASNVNSSAATNDFTEVRHVMHLPFEENGLVFTPLQLIGVQGLTAVLCFISPANAASDSSSVSSGLYVASFASPTAEVGQRPPLSPGAVSMVRLPYDGATEDADDAQHLSLIPSLFDTTVTVLDGKRGTMTLVDCLTGHGTMHHLFDKQTEQKAAQQVSFAHDPQLPGVISVVTQGSNTLRLVYFGKLLAVTFPNPLTQAAVASAQVITVRQEKEGDGLIKLAVFNDTIIAKYYNVLTEGKQDQSSAAFVGPVLGSFGSAVPSPTAQLAATDLQLSFAAPGSSDVALYTSKATTPPANGGDDANAKTVVASVSVDMLSTPTAKTFGTASSAPWDSSLKQGVKYDSQTGKMMIVNAHESTARVVNVGEVAPNVVGAVRRHGAEFTAKPVIGHDSASGYSTVLSGSQAAVVDTNAGRLDAEYNRWASVMDGKGGGLGSAPTAKDLNMSYSTPKVEPSGSLKHGKETDSPHVGGNTWAGGTGGTDTAGLGGLIGPYRLDKGHKIHQVDPELKKKVPKHIVDEAKHMGQVALKNRLAEIGMSSLDNERYTECYNKVRGSISQLQQMFKGLKAKEGERVWLKHQSDGVWDDAKIVEGLTGEKNIYKKRSDASQSSMFQHKKKKRLLFLVDVSASMYRFNSHDQRLTRMVETVVMAMESFIGHEDKISYSVVGHSGDSAHLPLVEFEHPPKNKKERMDVALKMIAYSQYCWSGDNTVAAMRRSIPEVLSETADDYFVFVISDANLQQYGINTTDLSRIIRSNERVHMYCIFIASFGAQASMLQRSLPPGHGFECMDTQMLPLILKRIFLAADLLGAS